MESNKNYVTEYNGILKEMDNIYVNLAKKFDMPECAFWILYTIRAENKPLTQKEICDMQYESKQTVNSALKSLSGKGIIEMQNAEDRRKKKIFLTDKGLQLAKDTVDKVIKAEETAFKELDSGEIHLYFSVAKKHTEILKRKIDDIFN